MIDGNYAVLIKQEAKRLGFGACGISKAEALTDDARRLEDWLKNGRHGSMQYMERNFDLRIDPRRLVEGAKSVITLVLNYYPERHQPAHLSKISKYAYGQDYHLVIREKLNELLHVMKEKIGAIHGRGFVDSAPILEKTWAVKSGLGWIGKNGNLILKKQGSFFFIATLVVDVAIAPDIPYQFDYCGSCTKCIDACPTQAILPNKEINGSQCISYFTIELKESVIPREKAWEDWIFGCDVCQDVCPWNRFSAPTQEPMFEPVKELFQFEIQDWLSLQVDEFKRIFKKSPLLRAKVDGLRRNVSFVSQKA